MVGSAPSGAPRQGDPAQAVTERRIARLEHAAAALSFVAGGIHAGVTPEHFDEWWGYGLFFVAAATAQIVYGLALVTRFIDTPRWPWQRVRRSVYLAGIVGNVAVLVLWAVTRTVGIPLFGPEAGTVEPVGPIDALSKLAEAVLVVTLAVAWHKAPPSLITDSRVARDDGGR